MPSPFDITVASNTVNLDNKREGVATFTVHNNTRRRLRATAQVTAAPADSARWLTILPPEGGSVTDGTARDFPIDSTQQYQVRIAVPLDAPPGSYTIKLTVADEGNPDDNFTESPEVLFTVREIPKETPKPLPGWLIPAIIIAVLVIVVIIGGVVVLSNRVEPTPTPTVVVGPCLVTLTADQLVYTRPEAIPDYIFDQGHENYQFVPIGRLADNSWWKTNYNDSWIETSTFGVTAEVTGDCTNLPIVFP